MTRTDLSSEGCLSELALYDSLAAHIISSIISLPVCPSIPIRPPPCHLCIGIDDPEAEAKEPPRRFGVRTNSKANKREEG